MVTQIRKCQQSLLITERAAVQRRINSVIKEKVITVGLKKIKRNKGLQL